MEVLDGSYGLAAHDRIPWFSLNHICNDFRNDFGNTCPTMPGKPTDKEKFNV
jgi:hypothetical protein